MIKKAQLTVIGLAAAYLVVTLVLGLSPRVSARTADKQAVAQTVTAQSAIPTAQDDPMTQCTESWPYYRPACLHDGRERGGRARVVRVIPTEPQP